MWILGIFLLGFLLLNVLALRHAHAMTVFTTGGSRTDSPEALGMRRTLKILFNGIRIPRPESTSSPADHGLPFEVLTTEAEDGLALSAWWSPAPDAHGTILLLHGYASCAGAPLAEAAHFYSLGWNVLVPDFRGSGASEGARTTIGIEEALDVEAWIAVARERSEGPLIIYGVSMGAAAALRAIATHDASPDALMLHAPFDRLLTTVRRRFSSMGVPSFLAAETLCFWGGRLHGFNAFRHNPVNYAGAVRCPTLVLHGDADPRVHVDEVQSIADALQGPKSLHIFEGLGHVSYLAHTPEAFRAVVDPWLAEQR